MNMKMFKRELNKIISLFILGIFIFVNSLQAQPINLSRTLRVWVDNPDDDQRIKDVIKAVALSGRRNDVRDIVIQRYDHNQHQLGTLIAVVKNRLFQRSDKNADIFKQLLAASEIIKKARQEERLLEQNEADSIKKVFALGIKREHIELNRLAIVVAVEAISLYLDAHYGIWKPKEARKDLEFELTSALLNTDFNDIKGIPEQFFETVRERPELLSYSRPLIRALMRHLLVKETYIQPSRYEYGVLGLARFYNISVWENEEEEIGLLDRILVEAFREIMIPREAMPELAKFAIAFSVYVLWRNEPGRLLELLAQFKQNKPQRFSKWFRYTDGRKEFAEQVFDEVIELVRQIMGSSSLPAFIETTKGALPDSRQLETLTSIALIEPKENDSIEPINQEVKVIELSDNATPDEVYTIVNKGAIVFIRNCKIRYSVLSDSATYKEYKGPVLFAIGKTYNNQLCVSEDTPLNVVINKIKVEYGIPNIFCVVCNGENKTLGPVSCDSIYATGDCFVAPVVKPFLVLSNGEWVVAKSIGAEERSNHIIRTFQ